MHRELEVHIAFRTQILVMETSEPVLSSKKNQFEDAVSITWLIAESMLLQRPPGRSRSCGALSETGTKRREVGFQIMVNCYMLWFSPSQQVSTTQTLAHSHHGMGEENRKRKLERTHGLR